MTTIRQIVTACCVLHNIAIDAKDPVPPVDIDGFDQMIADCQIPPVPLQRQVGPRRVMIDDTARTDLVTNYFPHIFALDNNV